MSAEVISMKDFNKSVGENLDKCDNCGEPVDMEEYADEKWEWATKKSLECIDQAGASLGITMLIGNLVDDCISVIRDILEEEVSADIFHQAVDMGIAMSKERDE